jgi:hypothetical protein
MRRVKRLAEARGYIKNVLGLRRLRCLIVSVQRITADQDDSLLRSW